MWDLPETPDVILSFATLLGASAAFWGAYTAHSGLGTWRKERDADLAKRLVAAIYRHRTSLYEIFRPDTFADDHFPSGMHFDPNDRRLTADVASSRHAAAKEKRADVEPLLAEAEIRWRPKVVALYAGINSVELEILGKILHWQQGKDESSYLLDRDYRQNNEGSEAVMRAFEPILDYLKTKI